jgi:excisionase family DNA binding protein
MNLVEILQEKSQALTVAELAILLRISQRQLYKLAAANRIPSFKIGASVRFDPASVAAWLGQRMSPMPVHQLPLAEHRFPQPQPYEDYRDRYEKLTGHSLRECPVCHRGRMITVLLLPKVHAPPAIPDRYG